MKALYLEPDEEITSVIDRLREIDDKEVAIVVPKRAGLLQSIINLKLLRYQGEQLKKTLSIVTTDKTGRNLAGAVGLTVHQHLPEGNVKEAAIKERRPLGVPIAFRRGKSPADAMAPTPVPKGRAAAKLTKQAVPGPATEAASEAAAKATQPSAPARDIKGRSAKAPRASLPKFSLPRPALPTLRLPKWRLPRLGRRRGPAIVAALLIVLLGGGVAAAAVLPAAEVVVTTKTDPFSAEAPVTFSAKATAPDPAARVIPAKLIEVTRDATVTATATGSKSSGAKATGPITIVNGLSRNQSLVARTRFRAPDGRIYRIQSAVSVPASGQVEATVVADDGGEAGNLEAGVRLAIPGLSGSAVYGQTNGPVTGGANSATPEVSDADADKARIALAATAAREGLDEAKAKLAVGNKLDEQVVTTDLRRSQVSPPVGAAAGSFAVSGTVKIVYFTYDDNELQRLLEPDLKAKVPAGADLVSEATKQTFVAGQTSSDRLTGVVQISSQTTQEISRDQIKRELSGKSAAEAVAALQATGKVSNATVNLSPFWVKRVPRSDQKITVRFSGGPAPGPSPSPLSSALPTLVPQI